MRVFIAGATGAIGLPLTKLLAAAGHNVTGMTRSEAKVEIIRAAGAEPAICDALDAQRLRGVVAAARPEAVIHQLTDLPREFGLKKLREAYVNNNLLRSKGTENLVAAAQQAGAARFVVGSMATWYEPKGSELKTEGDPLYIYADEPVGRAVRTLQHMEQAVLDSGLEAVVLRYGAFYGPGTWYGKGGSAWQAMLDRRYPLVGEGSGVYSWIQVDDAARATILALTGARPGIYNIVDDEPALTRDWLPAFARAIQAKPPRHVPVWIARLVAGRGFVEWDRTMAGASNAKFKGELGWKPVYRSWRTGFEIGLG